MTKSLRMTFPVKVREKSDKKSRKNNWQNHRTWHHYTFCSFSLLFFRFCTLLINTPIERFEGRRCLVPWNLRIIEDMTLKTRMQPQCMISCLIPIVHNNYIDYFVSWQSRNDSHVFPFIIILYRCIPCWIPWLLQYQTNYYFHRRHRLIIINLFLILINIIILWFSPFLFLCLFIADVSCVWFFQLNCSAYWVEVETNTAECMAFEFPNQKNEKLVKKRMQEFPNETEERMKKNVADCETLWSIDRRDQQTQPSLALVLFV